MLATLLVQLNVQRKLKSAQLHKEAMCTDVLQSHHCAAHDLYD